MNKKIALCYFSPCKNVKNIVTFVGEKLANMLSIPVEEYDFTLSKAREIELTFDESYIVILGTPVYAGRIPNKIMPYIRDMIHFNGALCVCVVSFGNRSFDDALAESVYLTGTSGGKVIAAGAVVSEHSFAASLATGRPNAEDYEELSKFAKQIVNGIEKADAKLNADGENQAGVNCIGDVLLEVPGVMPPEKYYTPLKEDGSPAQFLKAVPCVDADLCTHCGICATVCPMGSVDANDSSRTNGICIKCQACIKSCPSRARYFDHPDFLSHAAMLAENYTQKKENVFVDPWGRG